MASVKTVDLKLEAIAIPVSGVDRAKEFYGGLGWRLDWYAVYMAADQAGTELPA